MLMLDAWEQTAVFNPSDPTQKKIEKYAGVPGAYATYYFNRVPVPGSLNGPFTSAIGTGAGLAIGAFLGTLALGAGLYGLNRVGILRIKRGPKTVEGLGWLKRRRRRRR